MAVNIKTPKDLFAGGWSVGGWGVGGAVGDACPDTCVLAGMVTNEEVPADRGKVVGVAVGICRCVGVGAFTDMGAFPGAEANAEASVGVMG